MVTNSRRRHAIDAIVEEVRDKTTVFPSAGHYDAARERGRALAANAMIADPEARKRVEDRYGVANCRVQYPEVYGIKRRPIIVLP